MRDPYEVLGVGRDATDQDIKAAFRRLAREHHPDRNPDDPDSAQRFKEISGAYEVLSDPDKRQRYERRYGARGRGPTAPDFTGGFAGTPFAGIEDWLSEILGAGFAPSAPADSGDIEVAVDLAFEEAVLGCSRAIAYRRTDRCERCEGTGAHADASWNICRTCAGSGRARVQTMSWMSLAMDTPCRACNATGRVPDRVCPECSGQCLVERLREVNLTLPAGVEGGAIETVIGAGSRLSMLMPPGDLKVRINVRPHASFKRDANDVESDVQITFAEAALGCDKEVDTVHGKARLRVAPGTGHDSVIRLRGKGVPHRFRAGSGDHRCVVKVSVPKTLSANARELLQRFEQQAQEEEQGVFERLKGFFKD